MAGCVSALVGVAACAGMSSGAPDTFQVTGTATYRERMLLPPGARLEVTVEDVSRADAPAIILGHATVNSPGAPPIPFTVAYAADRIVPGGRYSVRARVVAENQLMFSTDTFNALPAVGDTTPLSLMMVRVRNPPSTAGLVNTYWKLLQLGDTQVSVAEQQREPHLILQARAEGVQRVAGFAGCNRMMGSYTLEGDQLAFTQMAGTMMACAQGMDTEKAFHAALGKVTRWVIRGEQLDLFDAAGNRVALLESRYLQ